MAWYTAVRRCSGLHICSVYQHRSAVVRRKERSSRQAGVDERKVDCLAFGLSFGPREGRGGDEAGTKVCGVLHVFEQGDVDRRYLWRELGIGEAFHLLAVMKQDDNN